MIPDPGKRRASADGTLAPAPSSAFPTVAAMPPYTVAVRTLAEFSAKAGDLDLRFTPAPTAMEGMAGHAMVAHRRPAHYETEIALSGVHGPVAVRGRADGFDPVAGRLEEVKTHRGRLDRQPRNQRELHWAQCRLYGWLLCQSRGLPGLELALVYFHLDTEEETVIAETWSAGALREHFERCCERFAAWAEQERAHREARDAAWSALRFPHEDFRPGQRALAEAVYRSARAGRRLLAQAPTGIGKTVGTLFPMLRAAPAQGLDRIHVLTAKTSGRQLALDAVSTLRRATPDLPLRALELVARDKACEHPDKACHGESCPLARGFYDRLPGARQGAVALPLWDRASVRALAQAHEVCPYYLTQELARWADLVVGDYNHGFDVTALLQALRADQGWKVGLLVDEAHNLVDRARGMYSAALEPAAFESVRKGAPAPLKRPLGRVRRAWKALDAAQTADYQVHETLPGALVAALQQATSAVLDLAAEQPDAVPPALMDFCFDALHFVRLAEAFGPHSLFDTTRAGAGLRLALRNVVPAPFLKERFAALHTATLFSATLQPPEYHREMLGLPEDTAWLDVGSPFAAEQLQVEVARRISTRWQHRAQSIAPIVQRIAAQFEARPGNYLAFFSSFDYLEAAAAALAASHPQLPLWAQRRGMSEAEQADFLARFAPGGAGIGFAVLGGAFAEGVDLPGDRLIGAFIATLGLPQVNAVNEQFRRRIDRLHPGRGFDYVYLYPGLQKVVQAAGRVIRSEHDRGVVHLMDDRYGRPDVQRLLPGWWSVPGRRDA